MRNKRLPTVVMSMLVLFTAPIDVKSQTGSNPLADTEWRLAHFSEAIREIPVVSGTTITLKFGSDGRVSGSAGCNNYSGGYNLSGEKLSFGRLVSTKKACVNTSANLQEQRYLRALESATSFRMFENLLIVFSGSGLPTLTFTTTGSPARPVERGDEVTGPVETLASFYQEINARDYEDAYRYWETPPAPLAEFQRGYRYTTKVQLIVQPPIAIEGAAGSSYVDIPTVIVATAENGSERIFAGCYTMRRSNIRGAETTGHVWKIFKANMSPAPLDAPIPQLLARACQR